MNRKMRFQAITASVVTFVLLFVLIKTEGLGAVTGLPPDLQKRIFLSMKTEKTKAYEKEKVALMITLSTVRLSVRDIQYPQFAHDGFSSGEFGNPFLKTETVDGITYDTMEFTTYIIPQKTGDLALGPARLQCNVLMQSSKGGAEVFFGGRETYALDLKSEKVIMNILPLPEEGRPADFFGAVGSFDLTVEVSRQDVKVGDPLKIMTSIKGSGNLNAAACPGVSHVTGIESHFKIYASRLLRRNGDMICEQVLIPLSENASAVPKIHFSFFNPDSETYTTLNKGPFPLKITSPGVFMPVEAEEDGKERPDSTIRRTEFNILLSSITALLFLLLILVYTQKVKISRFIREKAFKLHKARKMRSSLKNSGKIIDKVDSEEFYTIIFRTLQAYLGDAYQIHHPGITADIVENVLKSGGMKEDVAEKIKTIFAQCDMARYASFEFSREEMKETLVMMKEVMKYKHIVKVCHSRAGGNPETFNHLKRLDYRSPPSRGQASRE